MSVNDVDHLLSIIARPGVIAYDLETTVSRLYDREICTVQVKHEDGGDEAVVHCFGQPEIRDRIMKGLRESPATFVAHFHIFEAETLLKFNGLPQRLECTFIAARVLRGVIPGNGIDPDFSLAGLMMSELGVAVNKETRKRDWREPLDDEAVEYCLDDVRHALDLWTLYSIEFELDDDQWRGYRIIADALPAIAECNNNGLVFNSKAHAKLCVIHAEEADLLRFEMDMACRGAIENPNSAKQVAQWCADEVCFEPTSQKRASMLFNQMTGIQWKLTAGGQLSLSKDYLPTILGAIEENWPNVAEYLRLRLKYQKHAKLLSAFGPNLETMVDPDGHLRGSLIPHAARTSRLSCRTPNLQQMPAEDIFRAIFEAVHGRVIVQADYSQIELRVGCLIAGDTAMQTIFTLGHDIHTATACGMHHIPVEEFDKANPVHVKWRKDGKPVTFACIAEGQKVLTQRGLVAIESVCLWDLVWDGLEWVRHDGVVFQGFREVITVDGLTATPDHEVFISDGEKVRLDELGERQICRTELHGYPQRIHNDNRARNPAIPGWVPLHGGDLRYLPQHRMAQSGQHQGWKSGVSLHLRRAHLWARQVVTTRPPRKGVECQIQSTGSTVQQPARPRVSKLWRAWDQVRVRVSKTLRGLLPDSSAITILHADACGPNGQRWPLHSGEYSLHHKPGERLQHPQEPLRGVSRETGTGGAPLASAEAPAPGSGAVANVSPTHGEGRLLDSADPCSQATPKKVATYDLLNAGPRNRFTVSGYLVSNCLYGAQASTIAVNSALPMAEAEHLLNSWLEVYPGIANYRNTQPDAARAAGCIQLVSGQKITVRKDSRPPQLINAPVQGSAASVLYRALTLVRRALQASGLDVKLALNVHDEILLDSAEEDAVAAAKLLQDCMTQALVELYPEVREQGMDRVADATIIQNWGAKDAPGAAWHEWEQRRAA